MPDVLLDSTTYIDLEKAVKHRRESWAVNSIAHILRYRQENGNLYLSIVTAVEILRGFHRSVDTTKVDRFKQTTPTFYNFLDITTDVGYLASEIIGSLEDRRQAIGFPDCLIAATAIHHGLDLITSNDRHFQRVINLGYPVTLQNWRNV